MIGARLWRRKRSQRVATRPVAFNDSSDFHDDFSLDASELSSALPTGAPRPIVHRSFLTELLSQLEEPYSIARGMGSGEDPMEEARRRAPLTWRAPRKRVVSGRPSQFRIVRSPKSQRRIDESWREFNRLRLHPATRVCVSRAQRRSVLFAARVAGRRHSSPGRGGRYRRDVNSQWSCK